MSHKKKKLLLKCFQYLFSNKTKKNIYICGPYSDATGLCSPMYPHLCPVMSVVCGFSTGSIRSITCMFALILMNPTVPSHSYIYLQVNQPCKITSLYLAMLYAWMDKNPLYL